ncbi:MAG: hypothetical protein Q9169_008239 [Polycauliona sp. 2 TL-2023]
MEHLSDTESSANGTTGSDNSQYADSEMLDYDAHQESTSSDSAMLDYDADGESSDSEITTVQHDQSSKAAGVFPFMKLSPELRNMVYKEVLVEPKDVLLTVGHEYDPPHVLAFNPPQPSGLLQVSKQIYNEASPIYYRGNTFDCHSVGALHAFLSKLSIENRRSIRSLSFGFFGYAPAKSMKLLQGCTSLKSLKVVIPHYMMNDYGREMPDGLRDLPGLRDFLKIRGIQELDASRAPNCNYWEHMDPEALIEELQVVKLPKTAAMIGRQDLKDYPPERAKRTVYGKANVKTRSERALEDKETKPE